MATSTRTTHRQNSPRVLLPAIGVLLLLACSPEKTLWQSGFRIPGVLEKPMRVERVIARGDYLAGILAGKGFSIEVYLPNNESCRAVFAEGAELNYLEGAPGGVYELKGLTCRSSGIGTLDEWRSRRPRPRSTGSLIARGLASYRLVYQDDEVAFLRGRFPLAGKLGFVGSDDTIVVVPKTAECEAPIARTRSSMEYYPTGKKVLTLVSTPNHCPIAGLIAPFARGRPQASASALRNRAVLQ